MTGADGAGPEQVGGEGTGATVDAVVLAGGYATRLWPITRHRPKMFLPIGESVVIDRVLDELEADDRVDDVYVSTNERFADDFREHLATSAFEKPVLSVEESSAEGEKLGVIGALSQLVDREGIDDDLLVVAGDNVFDFPLSEFIDFFEARGAPSIAAHDVGSEERAKSYGVVELDDGRVVGFQEKPDRPESTLVSIACYGFPSGALSRIDEYLADDNNPDEPGWLIQWLHSRDRVWAYPFDDAWFDIGTPENYLDAVAWALDGDTIVGDEATLEGTTLGENVHVMDDATVDDAHLERCVVFPGATVVDCDLRGSIVDEGTRVDSLDLNGALIGAHSRIENGG